MIKVKTPAQIDGIRKSCILSADALQFAGNVIRAGMTSNELDKLIYEYIKEKGGVPAPLGYMDYPKSTCISVNEIVCHGIPNNRPFVDGDIVKVDVSTILDGFYGDNCATFAIGEISEEAQRLIETAKECLWVGIEEVKPEAPINNIGRAITKLAQSKNFGVVYEYSGHGTGCEFHERPQISHAALPFPGVTMKPGWIFTIEPMINCGVPKTLLNEVDKWTVSTADGKLSAQFEHTILVTETGHEILTIPSYERVEINED